MDAENTCLGVDLPIEKSLIQQRFGNEQPQRKSIMILKKKDIAMRRC